MPDRNRYGVSDESFRQIKSNSQASSSNLMTVSSSSLKESTSQLTLNESQIIRKLTETINYQANQFQRYRDLTEKKFNSLAKDMLEMSVELKAAINFIQKFKNKEEVISSREKLINYQQGDKKPCETPIDRNGVAPKDVTIESIFNCAGKKF